MTTTYSKDHEYVRSEGNIGVVGISDFAQSQLGDIVFVELPKTGATVKQGDEIAVVESVKAASEIYAPVSGTITEVNEELTSDPGLINAEPEGRGWLFKLEMSDATEAEKLMDAEAYAAIAE